MDNIQLQDLKEFIDGRVGQAETQLKEDLGGQITDLRDEVLDDFTGVGEAIEQINERLDKHIAEKSTV